MNSSREEGKRCWNAYGRHTGDTSSLHHCLTTAIVCPTYCLSTIRSYCDRIATTAQHTKGKICLPISFFSTSTTSLKPFSVFQLIVHERHHVLQAYAAEIHIALPIGLGLSQRQADLLNAISQSHSDCTLHTARLGRFRKTMSECSLFCRVLFLFLFYTTILLFFSLFL